jgi:hypothetical protein
MIPEGGGSAVATTTTNSLGYYMFAGDFVGEYHLKFTDPLNPGFEDRMGENASDTFGITTSFTPANLLQPLFLKVAEQAAVSVTINPLANDPFLKTHVTVLEDKKEQEKQTALYEKMFKLKLRDTTADEYYYSVYQKGVGGGEDTPKYYFASTFKENNKITGRFQTQVLFNVENFDKAPKGNGEKLLQTVESHFYVVPLVGAQTEDLGLYQGLVETFPISDTGVATEADIHRVNFKSSLDPTVTKQLIYVGTFTVGWGKYTGEVDNDPDNPTLLSISKTAEGFAQRKAKVDFLSKTTTYTVKYVLNADGSWSMEDGSALFVGDDKTKPQTITGPAIK